MGWSVVGLLVVGSTMLTDPSLLGLSTYQPIAHLVAMRGWLALGGFLLAAVLLGCALLVRHRAEHRPTRLAVGFLVLALFASVNVGLLWSRGVSAPESLPDDKRPGDVDVLVFNTFNAVDGPAAIADLVERDQPDVVVLSETLRHDAQLIGGGRFEVFMGLGNPRGSAPTALLVATSMGGYQRIDGPDTEYGIVGAAPLDGDGPVLYAVHIVSPISDRMQLWRDELDLVMGICDDTAGIIMAGDFNATVDHAPLRSTSCVDGSVGSGGVGTWPAGLPPLLGSPIDHVFADPATWTPVASAVLALPASDHRAVLVRLGSG
jgi:endonuclease/exonuclease/phosphatase (EEP) superfamily protein YafD